MKKKKDNNEKSLKKIKEESKRRNFINRIKKKWLVKGISTLALIAILIAIFVLINFGMKKWDPTPIDCTKSQDFSLSEESKERVKNIEKDVNIYFVGYEDTNQDYLLAKQYNKTNSKIKVEVVSITDAKTKLAKYKLDDSSQTIIVEAGEVSRTIDYYDTISYNSDYSTVSIAEQKITSAILNITSDKTPKAYYLTGYSSIKLDYGLTYLTQYLDNEVLTYDSLNILQTKKVPDDCDTLIIVTPEKDFDKLVADEIIKYVKKGGNILWFNSAVIEDEEFKNVNRVLAEYGVNSFEKGYIYESDSEKYYYGTNALFKPEIQETEVTNAVAKTNGAVFFLATKINVNDAKLESLKVEKTDLVLTADTAYFVKDITSTKPAKSDEKGSFTVGALLERTIKERTTEEDKEDDSVKSKLIIYGNDYFITDMQLSQELPPMIYIENNVDLGLNSLSYLNNRDVDITIRKSYSDSVTEFTPTDGEKTAILIVAFMLPVAIILFGLAVWSKRRNIKVAIYTFIALTAISVIVLIAELLNFYIG